MTKVCATLNEFRKMNSELENIWKGEIWVPLEPHLDKESDLVEKNYFLLEAGDVPLALCWPRERLIMNNGTIRFSDFCSASPKALSLLEINSFGYSVKFGYGAYLEHADYGNCFMFEDPQVATDAILWIYKADNPMEKFELSYNDQSSSAGVGLESDFARKYNAKFFAHTDQADIWVLPKKGNFWFLSRLATSMLRNESDKVDQALAEYNSDLEEYREFIRFTLIPGLKEVGTRAKLDGQSGIDWLELSLDGKDEYGSTRYICMPELIMELMRCVHECRLAKATMASMFFDIFAGADNSDDSDVPEDDFFGGILTAVANMMKGM